MIINDFQAFNIFCFSIEFFDYAGDIAQLSEHRVSPGFRIGCPFPGEYDILGGERTAVVEFGLRMKIKGVQQAVIADFPTGGKVGFYLQLAV